MAPTEPLTLHTQLTKLAPTESCAVSPWSASVARQDLIETSDDMQENGANCKSNVAHGHEAGIQQNSPGSGCMSNAYASDLKLSGSAREIVINGSIRDIVLNGSVREVVLNGLGGELQTCGSVAVGNNFSQFTKSFTVPPCRSQCAPPPTPPPTPATRQFSIARNVCAYGTSGKLCVPKEHMDIWDSLFLDGYKADVVIDTEDGDVIAAHSTVLAVASPVFRAILEDRVSWPRSIALRGVTYHAAKVFVRFLYSSRYEEEEMEEFIVQLLVLSHAYCVPSLKRLCTHHLECGLLTHENVVDIFQLARLCDAPRLHLLCHRVILNSFKEVARTEGWRVMRDSNPKLEQELVEAVIESDSTRREKLRKMEDDKVYEQLHDAMEALVHICRDGCRTIGPHDKEFTSNKQGPCKYPACKGLESLVRHFAGCRLKVSGGCVHCKRMWQLLELHSQMCQEASCKVPLCGHFRNKIGHLHSEQHEMRWRLLVKKVVSAKSATSTFSIAALSAKFKCIA